MKASKPMAALILCLSGPPCLAAGLRQSAGSMVDSLASNFLAGRTAYSKAAVAVLPIQDRSALARKHGVGAAAAALVEEAISASLVFALVDGPAAEASLREIELAVSGMGSSNSDTAETLEIDLAISGSVEQRGELFEFRLELLDAAKLEVLASASAAVPVSELVAYGDELARPFGMVGVFGGTEWFVTNSSFGSFVPAAGFLATLPVSRFAFVRLGAEGIAGEGDQAGTQAALRLSLPDSLAGTNRIACGIVSAGFGFFAPVSRLVCGYVGARLALGADWRKAVYDYSAEEGKKETSPDEAELCFGGFLEAGIAFRLADRLVLALETGVGGMTFGLSLSSDTTGATEGSLCSPLRAMIAVPLD